MAMLDLNYEEVEKCLIKYIQDYMHNTGFENLVLGMSGGLDSSMSAALASKAIGPENVYGYSLPYNQDSDAAVDFAYKLGINYDEIDIWHSVREIAHACNLNYDDEDFKIRQGNICARTRMIILYDQSKEKDALVLGTGNKSEYWLGYTTMWGDMACSFTPLGGLFKTQERKLAEYMKLPKEIIQKAPSAGLWKGQTDEDEMGFTYAQADGVLSVLLPRCTYMDALIPDLERAYIEEVFEEIKSFGISSDVIEKVWERVKTTEFKRRMPDSPYLHYTGSAIFHQQEDLFNRAI